jgi:hypothetical protein
MLLAKDIVSFKWVAELFEIKTNCVKFVKGGMVNFIMV